ncbi:UbiA prenyltransferase family [Collybia nuda]|uniref:UbiA prenyltransferase family n=1 Tax=Collybia nuda TaxID=64659 RepID=A0A9P5Y0D9_9AGAR|nr:UbiA prenyltransferase family [Collybia nuda]
MLTQPPERNGKWRSLNPLVHLHTLILFTWTDYQTIVIPITIFACATAPIQSLSKLIQGCVWIWFHLILCNVSNQVRAKEEDSINRPWRPLPSGRVAFQKTLVFRWIMVILCVIWSAIYGFDIVVTTLGLIITTIFYDEGQVSRHPFGRNLCNVGRYIAFQFGATTIMNRLDRTSMAAILLSGVMILTTIQAQDFPDVDGDIASNRITFPIYTPELSRVFTFFIIPLWSFILCWFWEVGWLTGFTHITFSIYVGARYYFRRTPGADTNATAYSELNIALGNELPTSRFF